MTFGIGQHASAITNFYARASYSALAHGMFQGTLTGVQGGNFWQGFAAGAISSLASSAWQGGSNGTKSGFFKENNWAYGTKDVAVAGIGSGTGTGGMIAFGTIMGGAGAALTRGNFWQGAVTGLVVSGLNHAMHDSNGEAEIEQTKHTNETTATDEKPYVLNESKKTIHYKPESTSEALPLGPGQKTYDAVDGINVRGKVSKVSNGYKSVTIKANFKVYMRYDNLFYLGVGMYKGGLVTRSNFDKNDTGWDNLFKINN